MDQPLGRSAGNALEVIESIETLKGNGPSDTRHLTIELTALMTVLAGVHADVEEARLDLNRLIDSGAALACFRRMIEEQRGESGVIDDYSKFGHAGVTLDVLAESDGFVQFVDAEAIGRVVLQLGGGRRRSTDEIDHAAGIDQLVQQGESVETRQPLMRLHAANSDLAHELLTEARTAVTVGDEKPGQRELIIERL